VVRQAVFAIPGDIATPTGGYAYDRRIIAELRQLGWQVDVLGLGDGFPRPAEGTKQSAGRLLQNLPGDIPAVIDGLAFGVLPEAAEALRGSHCLVALVHHPLALETGLSRGDADTLRCCERRALACARHVIANSETTARGLVSDYDVPPGRISVVVPGCDRAAFARGGENGVVSLLAVGSIVPRKGYDVLLAALAILRDLPWTLTIAGDTTRDLAATAQLMDDIARFDLVSQVTVVGAVDDVRIGQLYDGADVFVLASRYEGYGMAFTEAIAHGLPVVGTRAGAIPEAVPEGAGLLVPPDDAPALAGALRLLIGQPEERRRLAAAARAAATALPAWQTSAVRFAQVLEAVS